jgi:hypothetical protein
MVNETASSTITDAGNRGNEPCKLSDGAAIGNDGADDDVVEVALDDARDGVLPPSLTSRDFFSDAVDAAVTSADDAADDDLFFIGCGTFATTADFFRGKTYNKPNMAATAATKYGKYDKISSIVRVFVRQRARDKALYCNIQRLNAPP